MKPSDAFWENREEIRRVVASNRASNPRVVFGWMLDGEDNYSDLNLIIDPLPNMTLFDYAEICCQFEALLGGPVYVATPKGLPEKFRAKVLAEAQPV